jgi:hypothetical protein
MRVALCRALVPVRGRSWTIPTWPLPSPQSKGWRAATATQSAAFQADSSPCARIGSASVGGLLEADDGTIACGLEDVKEEIAAVINSTFDPTKWPASMSL